MTKVFLIKGRSGSWEDYSEWIAEAYFDEFIANQKCDEMNRNMNGMKSRYDELCDTHIELAFDCSDECELCNEFYDLQMITEDMPTYSVHEIDVL